VTGGCFVRLPALLPDGPVFLAFLDLACQEGSSGNCRDLPAERKALKTDLALRSHIHTLTSELAFCSLLPGPRIFAELARTVQDSVKPAEVFARATYGYLWVMGLLAE
jgi:hypothetical protein